MKNIRLVSLFGVGDYDSVRYQWGDGTGAVKTSARTQLVQAAIVELVPKVVPEAAVTSVAIIGSAEALRNFGRIGGSEFRAKFSNRFSFDQVAIPDTARAQREVFAKVVERLKMEALPDLGEVSAPDELIVDITHGLKPQALIVGAAVMLLLTDLVRRAQVRSVPIRVVYGKFDKTTDGPKDREIPGFAAPIWDLTEYITANLWTLAVQASSLGQTSAVQVLGLKESSDVAATWRDQGLSGSELAPTTYAKRLAGALEQFTEALACLRAEGIQASSKVLIDRLDEADNRKEMLTELPALKSVLDDMERAAHQVRSDTGEVLDPAGIRSLLGLTKLYGARGQAAHHAVALREAFHALYRTRFVESTPVFVPTRVALETWAAGDGVAVPTLEQYDRNPSAYLQVPRELVKDVNNVGQLRNDVLHLGLNKDARRADDLRTVLNHFTQRLEYWIDALR